MGVFNSYSPGRCGSNFKHVISEHMLWINKFMGTSCENALRWMPQTTFDDKWTLVQLVALSWIGDKPLLPEPVLTKIAGILCCLKVTLS